MKINKKIIEELVGYLKEFNLSEIEYAEDKTKVKVSRSINNSPVTEIFFLNSDGIVFEIFIDRETFTFVVPSAYSISLRLNSFK